MKFHKEAVDVTERLSPDAISWIISISLLLECPVCGTKDDYAMSPYAVTHEWDPVERAVFFVQQRLRGAKTCTKCGTMGGLTPDDAQKLTTKLTRAFQADRIMAENSLTRMPGRKSRQTKTAEAEE